MLCPVHHRAVHEGGWNVEADGRGGFTFLSARGVPVPELALVSTPTSPDAVVRANTDAGVAITPGRDFGVHAPKRHVRFSYANTQAQLQEGVRRIAAFLGRSTSEI